MLQVTPTEPGKKPVNPITELFQLLQAVDTKSPEAELNESSMSDNNGGRILF